ncbi:MAG: hypothetical protein EOO91_02035 [Pedobacter sp.]|nr:MAG: hypothetical protein EOO91_02035 [Pedobacter sp.]
MKKIFLKPLLFFILFASISFTTTAQTVDWDPSSFTPSSGSYTASSTARSYTYDSDLLYAKFTLDTNGHTVHYDVMVKNIPVNTGAMKGEFQAFVGQDTAPGELYASKFLIWNDPTYVYYYPYFTAELYPSTTTYSYSGSCEIGNEETAFVMEASIMFWNEEEDFLEYAQIRLYPRITR